MADRAVLLELDSRRRLSMSSVCSKHDRWFLASKRGDGSILLEPADVRPRVLQEMDRDAVGWASRVREDYEAGLPAADSDTWRDLRDRADEG